SPLAGLATLSHKGRGRRCRPPGPAVPHKDRALPHSLTLAERAAKVELLLLDVDGVLTDGSVIYADDGTELKRFHVRDGSGLKLWHLAGKRSAIVSGRKSVAVERRALELGVSPVLQGRDDKLAAMADVLTATGLSP